MIPANSFSVNGGKIAKASDSEIESTAESLKHPKVGGDGQHRIDGAGPRVHPTIRPESGSGGRDVEVTFDEPIGSADASLLRMTNETNAKHTQGTGSRINGNRVRFDYGDIGISAPEDDLSLQIGEGTVHDRAGNPNPGQSPAVCDPNTRICSGGQPVTVDDVVNNYATPGHPSAVRMLEASAGNQRVHLTWKKPVVATGGEDDRYIYQYEYRMKVGSGSWGEWTPTPESPPVGGMTKDGLDNGTEYSFQVRAKNKDKKVGPDGDTVSATPVASYCVGLSRWGIKRGGEPTKVTLSLGYEGFREERTYTMEWNGQATNQGLLHANNPTSITLPAGRTQASVNLRAAADDDGPSKVYNLEVQHPLVILENGDEVTRTKPGELYDGNLSVHDNDPKPVISLEAPETVAEGEDFHLTARMTHRLENDAVIGFDFNRPGGRGWELSGVPEPRTITIAGGDLTGTAGPMRRPDDEDNDGDSDITFQLDNPRRGGGNDDPWTLSDYSQTVRFTDDDTPDSERRAPRLSIEDASGDESDDGSDSTLTFLVKLADQRVDKTRVKVDFRTVDGTATAGEDYEAKSGTLTFAPGDTSRRIVISIRDDNVQDSGETFDVIIEDPTNGAEVQRRKGRATGTINDDDKGALGASFPSSRFMSRRHTGSEDRPQVVVEFTEAVASFTKTTPSVNVENGTIQSVRAHTEDGLDHPWIFFLTPDGNDAVRFRLLADESCEAGGICTESGKKLTDVPSTRTIPGPEETEEERSELAVADATASEEDDATIDFAVSLHPAAGSTVTVDYATEDGTAQAGSDYVAESGTLTFSPGETSKVVRVALIDDNVEDDGETFTLRLSNASGADIDDGAGTGTIRNMEAVLDPLTASISGVPAEHDGSTGFHFDLTFSEEPEIGYAALRDHAFDVDNGNINQAKRKTPGSNLAWRLRVRPSGRNRVSFTLPETTSCSANGGVCTSDGRKLSHSLSHSVAGPAGISVSDARVEEAAGAVLAFTVTLSRSTATNVTVDYATSDGTAEAGADYTATSGTLTIPAGNTSATIEVPVLDDAHDDDETLTLTLSNPTGAVLDDATATGTIDNNDVMPRALMARFGRTAAVHVIDRIEERMNAPRRPGFDGRIAGRNIDRNMGRDFALGFCSSSEAGTATEERPRAAGRCPTVRTRRRTPVRTGCSRSEPPENQRHTRCRRTRRE